MSYCQKCGSYIPVDETVCPACDFDSAKESNTRNTYSGQGHYDQSQATASQGQYTQDWSQGSASQAQYAENRGQYTAQDRSRRPIEEPWTRPDQRWDPWAEGGRGRQAGRKRERGRSAGPYQSAPGDHRQAFTVPGDISDNRYLCILCYLGPLFLVPYLLRKDSPYVRFHANQGLLLLIAEILIPIAGNFVPFFGWAVSLAGWIFTLVCFFKGLNSTLNGRLDKLPLIGDINLIK
jgi:uncharacterized membrane protein